MSQPPEQPDIESTANEASQRASLRLRNRHTLQLSWIEKYLLFLSKTDLHALQFCTDETRNIQSSIGAMVLITGVLAFMSSFFAVENTFFRGNESLIVLPVAIMIALFYSTAIMMFDREVVSAPDKRAAWFRIPFAILIGLVISFPLELKLQQDRIDEQIKDTVKARHASDLGWINDFREKVSSEKNKDLLIYDRDIDSIAESLKELEVAHAKECLNPGRKGCGPIAESIKASADEQRSRLEALKAQRAAREKELDSLYKQRYAEEYKRMQKLIAETDQASKAHDFLSQFEALHQIKQDNPLAGRIGFALMAFFVMFELFPVLIKLFLPYTEYHAYLDARRRTQVNKIIGVTNFANDRIRSELSRDGATFDDIRGMLTKTEITDILEEVMEDRQIDLYDADGPSQKGQD